MLFIWSHRANAKLLLLVFHSQFSDSISGNFSNSMINIIQHPANAFTWSKEITDTLYLLFIGYSCFYLLICITFIVSYIIQHILRNLAIGYFMWWFVSFLAYILFRQTFDQVLPTCPCLAAIPTQNIICSCSALTLHEGRQTNTKEARKRPLENHYF